MKNCPAITRDGRTWHCPICGQSVTLARPPRSGQVHLICRVGEQPAPQPARPTRRRPKRSAEEPSLQSRRAEIARQILMRLRTMAPLHKPDKHRPMDQAEAAIERLAAAGHLDQTVCSEGQWHVVRDVLTRGLWRREWGQSPESLWMPTIRLAAGEMPKVAFLTPVLSGGVERWMLDLVGGLMSSGSVHCEVIAIEGVKRIDPGALAHMRELVPAHSIPIEAVERFLSEQAFHATVSWGMPQLPKVVGRFRPNLVCCHGSDIAFSAEYPRACLPVAAHFVAVSRAAQRPLDAAGVPRSQQTVVHNGVDPDRVRPTAPIRQIRLRYGFNASDFVVAYIGRFAPEKRAELLIEALQLLGDGYRGLLMGAGPSEATYRKADQAGRCVVVPADYEIGNALAVADAFIGLTRDEGFWYSGAEAALAHVPLITTRVGFLEELADELQPLPWIEVPKDVTPRMLADAIETCRRRPPDVARLAAAVDRWTIDRMADGWARVIAQAVGSSTAKQSEAAGEVLPAVSGERIHPPNVASPAEPSCSILMSVFDTPAAMLREAWESILAQTVRSWELVLVDDGSRDRETVAELDRIAVDPRVRMIRLAENGGLAAAHNVGLAACRCELVAVMDSDDVALPDRLQRQLAYLAAHPEADIVGGQIEVFEHATGKIHQVTDHPARVTASTIDALVEAGRGVWLLNHPATIYRRSQILAIGGYPTHLRRTQDLGLWLRAIRHGLVVQNQPDLVVRYRLHSAQLTGQREDHRREHDTMLWEEWLKWR